MWICCQLGAREHYSIPHSLYRANQLQALVTDAWANSWLPWKLVPGSRAAERFHPSLPSRLVASFDWSLLAFETAARRRVSGWELTMARNAWFQARVVKTLQLLKRLHPNRPFTLFSYSYTARMPFEFARQAGWRTVLGQIDPGPFEEKIVLDLYRKNGFLNQAGSAPPAYWNAWREECALADRIVVNSEWSAHGLAAEGIPAQKLDVVPLVYDDPPESVGFVRTFASGFDAARPLRVLFLGQVNLRKGVGEILAALPELAGLPVEFWMVGPPHLPAGMDCAPHPQLKWLGVIPRGAVVNYYRDADVFLFPTHSDGFGLTQLEAQAWRLPIVASRNCGSVVRDGENGFLLPEVTSQAIVKVIREILARPALLKLLAERPRLPRFTTGDLSARLAELSETTAGGR